MIAPVSRALLCGPTENVSRTMQRHLQNDAVNQKDSLDLITLCLPVLVSETKSHALPYTYHPTIKLSYTLTDLHTAGLDV